MGIEERKTREKENRRALILRKAKSLILERGVGSFSMQDIAHASELSKATLYLYFESKEAILIEILQEAISDFTELARLRIPADGTGLQALQALWETYLELLGESQDLVVLTGIKNYLDPEFPFGDANTSEKFAKATAGLVDLIEFLLRRGMEDGSIYHSDDPDRQARTVIMFATSVIDTISRVPRPRRDTALMGEGMRETFEMILRGLASDKVDRSTLRLSL
jgi:AcrR family transcriptional regulator